MSMRSLLPSRRMAPLAFAPLLLSALHSAALAHDGSHGAGLVAGLAHPFSGLDHLLAMVAVGLWAAQLGRPAVWVLPLTFPAVMAVGAMIGAGGVPLPGVEIAIAASIAVLGAAIVLSLKVALPVSATLIAAVALFHGHAHGAELPQAVSPLAYGIGFVAATLTLHGVGLALGFAVRHWTGPLARGVPTPRSR